MAFVTSWTRHLFCFATKVILTQIQSYKTHKLQREQMLQAKCVCCTSEEAWLARLWAARMLKQGECQPFAQYRVQALPVRVLTEASGDGEVNPSHKWRKAGRRGRKCSPSPGSQDCFGNYPSSFNSLWFVQCQGTWICLTQCIIHRAWTAIMS